MIIHPISNLNFGFHEFTDEADEVLPVDIDLVILCGGFSNRMKRSLLYCETMAQKYPNIKFILNSAPIEYNTEVPNILYAGMQVRYDNLPISNLIYSKESYIFDDYDVLTLVGWPKIDVIPDKLHKVFGEPRPKYLSDGECCNVKFRYFITKEEMNEFHHQEHVKLQNWLSEDSGKQKLLITGTSPIDDEYATNYSLYDNLDLSGVIWIHGGSSVYDKNVDGVRLICNPGRNTRQTTFVI